MNHILNGDLTHEVEERRLRNRKFSDKNFYALLSVEKFIHQSAMHLGSLYRGELYERLISLYRYI